MKTKKPPLAIVYSYSENKENLIKKSIFLFGIEIYTKLYIILP